MQGKTETNLKFWERLDRVRLSRGWTWLKTGSEMQLSVTMLHYIKTGKYRVTDKVLHRLSQLEAATPDGRSVENFVRNFFEALFNGRNESQARDIFDFAMGIGRGELANRFPETPEKLAAEKNELQRLGFLPASRKPRRKSAPTKEKSK